MTPEQLAQAAGTSEARGRVWYAPLADAMDQHLIITPARQAAFLAQVGHESGSLRFTRELWGPTPAQMRYEGRKNLGNVAPGDGYRFRGRGLIQITGRANYVAVSAGLGKDFVTVPQHLEVPEWAAKSAAWWWNSHGLNELADTGEFRKITRRINGGFNGLEDRERRWAAAKQALGVNDG